MLTLLTTAISRVNHRGTDHETVASKLLRLFLEKNSKDLQRSDIDVIAAVMVLSSLFETEEADAFACAVGNLEVTKRTFPVQVVVVSTINFRPRGPVV